MVIEVKGFHKWFILELFSGSPKYVEILEWCKDNGYVYLLWFEGLGFKTVEEISKIKNQDDLRLFKLSKNTGTPEDLKIFLDSEISKNL